MVPTAAAVPFPAIMFWMMMLAMFMAGAAIRLIRIHKANYWVHYTMANTVHRGIYAHVLLNGQPMAGAFCANTLFGYVDHYEEPMRVLNGEPVTRRSYGSV